MVAPTIGTVQAVAKAGSLQSHLLRDAYVDLEGIPATWWRVVEDDARRDDFYGDVKRELTRAPVACKIVLRLGTTPREILDTYPDVISEDVPEAVEGSIKYLDQAKAGDRYSFSMEHLVVGATDTKWLQVVRVNTTGHPQPVSKTVIVVPVRENSPDEVSPP